MADADSDNEARTAKVVTELIRIHGSQLQLMVTRIVRDPGVAQQVLQDTYLNLVQRLRQEDSTTPIANAAGYLFCAATTNALYHVRREAENRRMSPEIVVDDVAAVRVPDRAPGPAKAEAMRNVIEELNDLVDRLPEKQHRVFVAGKLQGRPYREIAMELGIEEASVQNLMTRALANLRAGLVERGIESALAFDDPLGQ